MAQTVSARSFGRRIVAVVAALFMAVGVVGVTATPAAAAGTGVIAGTVTGTANTPLQGIFVQIYFCDPNFNPGSQENCWTGVNTGGQILTAANGSYSIPNLDPGQYTAAFFPQSAPNTQYAYEYWNNQTSLSTATGFTVANGATSTVSPTLQVGAIISGTVFGPGGAAAPLTMVSATNTATPNQSSHAFVESDGTYQFVGLQPGEYYLWAGPDYSAGNPSTLVREYYDNKPDAASANRFTVGSGQTFTANFQLANGGIISGNVKNGSSVNLADIDVTVYKETTYGWQQVKVTTTNASGNYTFEGLETGNYVVRFSDFGGTYAQRYGGNVVDRAAATKYSVGPGVNATAVNVTLSAGGGITGTVTQTPTGGSAIPSNQGYVDVIKVTGGVQEVVSSIQTNASGVYTLTGLAAGNYTILTSGDNTDAWAQTYRGPAYYPEDATTVAVSGTATVNAGTTNVVPGTRLTGHFTDTSGVPIPTVQVKILYERTPGNWIAPPPAGGAGDPSTFIVSRLPPGRYIVYFEDSAATNKYVTQYYNNKPTLGTATVIEAPNGGNFANINAQLTRTPHPAVTASASVSPASPNGSNGWYKSGNVTVTLTSGGGTVVPDKLEYKIAPATTWTTYTAPIVVSSNGTSAITYRAVEEGLQNSAEGSVTIKRDVALPTVSSSISGRTVTVTSADTGSSGVASTEYKLGNGSWAAYTAPVNVGNAAVTFQFRATDAAGNVSTVGTREVPAAVGAVTLTVTPTPATPNGTNGWYTSNVTVVGTATAELGGTVTVESKIGAGSYAAQASRTVSSDTTGTVLTFRANDQFGNQSSETPITIKLDKVAPNATHSTSGRTVTIGATDATSSVARIEYRINGTGSWQLYGMPVTVPESASSLEYRAVDNAGNTSTPVSVPLTSGLPVPERIDGANRWAVAAEISEASYPTGSDVVYITSGLTFPDALSAGPAAARDGAPMLLVYPTSVPQPVLDEIARLTPNRIVVIGGTATVSTDVYAQLGTLVGGQIERISGANRYEASRNVAEYSFDTAEVAYIATGTNFPDALAGGGAAGINDAPIILVNGAAGSLDAATTTLLESLDVQEIKILGGTSSVSAGIETGLNAIAPTQRLSGTNRYTAAVAINEDAFPGGADMVLIATGLNFPDALGGSTWAAKAGAPLYVVPQNCIPAAVLESIEGMGPSEIHLLGGANTLSPAVQSLTPCP